MQPVTKLETLLYDTQSLYQSLTKICCLMILALSLFVLSGCGGGGGNSGAPQPNPLNLLGSVGDGPVTGSTIKVTDANGAVIVTTMSDGSASYSISVPDDTIFPTIITSTGGTDVVTGTSPDFTMISVALGKSDLQNGKIIANINPFSTFIVKMAQAMPGGLNRSNLTSSKQILFQKFSFGLDSNKISDPVNSEITPSNVAGVIKASEAIGEMIRRTRDAMITSGNNIDGNGILTVLANDLADGVLDGSGSGANAIITATSKITSAQVLVETITNRLKVNGTLATNRLDSAIQLTESAATTKTIDVLLTDSVLLQTRAALADAERYSPSTALSTMTTIISTFSSNTLSKDANTLLATGTEDALDTVINSVPLATSYELSSINTGTVLNTAPTIITNANTTALEGSTYSYTVNATDTNTDDNLSYTLSNAPGGMSIDSVSGMISWTPSSSQIGNQRVTVVVTDDGTPLLSDNQSFIIDVSTSNVTPVNITPAITSNPGLSGREGQTYNYNVNATDSNSSDILSYALTSFPTGMAINSTSGLINWTPSSSQIGIQNVTVTVTDNGTPSLSSSQSFSISISSANIAPNIVTTPGLIAQEGKTYTYGVNAIDPNSLDKITYALANGPSGMQIDTTSGVVSWVPDRSDVGTTTVTVTANDDGSPSLSTSQTFTIGIAKMDVNAIRINAGGDDYIDSIGLLWSADNNYNIGLGIRFNTPINGTTDDSLYQSLRWNSTYTDTSAPELEYKFNVISGTYLVKLHFVEMYNKSRNFDVEIENNLVFNNLDITSEAGIYTVLVKTSLVNVTDGVINIRFPRNVNSPWISAIEIIKVTTETNSAASTTDTTSASITIPVASQNSGVLSIRTAPSNGTASVDGSGQMINYTPDPGFSGQDVIDYIFTSNSGSVTVSSIIIEVTCISCKPEPIITLYWLPSKESITGYRIYYGNSTDTTTKLLSDIALNSGLIDVTSPQMQYRATEDLNTSQGQQICFKIQAYSGTDQSAVSSAVCGVL